MVLRARPPPHRKETFLIGLYRMSVDFMSVFQDRVPDAIPRSEMSNVHWSNLSGSQFDCALSAEIVFNWTVHPHAFRPCLFSCVKDSLLKNFLSFR